MSYAAWWWAKFVKALDEAGYAIVKKPELKDKGKTAPRRPEWNS